MPVEHRYSTFAPRFWAGIVDGLVFLPVGLLDYYLSSPQRTRLVLIAWALFYYPVYWVYAVTLHTYRGQTVGKRAQGVIVMDVSERKLPSLKQALLRDVGEIVPSTLSLVYFVYLVVAGRYVHPLNESSGWPMLVLSYSGSAWFLLEIVTMFTNRKRRALHDLIAGTVVVRVDSVPVAAFSRAANEPSTTR